MEKLDLSGSWEILFDFSEQYRSPSELPAGDGWQTIMVPGCWEQVSSDRVSDGPVWYRKRFNTPTDWSVIQTALDFHGVNYYSETWLNGQPVGEHSGGWTGFRLSIPNGLLRCDAPNELIIKVYKQGARFPLRESLAGFLPDVNFIFGGIWKGVWLTRVAAVEVDKVFVKPQLDANCANVEYTLTSSSDENLQVSVSCLITSADGHLVGETHEVHMVQGTSGETYETVATFVEQADWWSIENPVLYGLTVRCLVGEVVIHEYHCRFGMRDVKPNGSQLLLNQEPIYLRGALNWGWYRELAAPIPTREQIRDELRQLKENGFNLVKLCLFVPTAEYFEIADEIGILLWQELPLWQPVMSERLKEALLEQYSQMIHDVRNHPSLVLWTLGCELNQVVDSELLKELYDLTKCLTNNAVVRDNSGSGECYGGLLNEHADFYDYHFYTDVHFFPDLMAQFAGSWRPTKPWLFGEFCDYDTFRDVERLRIANHGDLPWWLRDDPVGNPASRNRLLNYCRQEQALATLDLPFSSDDLLVNSIRSAYVYRKTVLEMVRTYPNVCGYVITSIRDTPISTSAILNDFDETKHDAPEFRRINHDTVVALTWDHRRDWINGGDRVVNWDHYNYLSGEIIRPHVFVSHYGNREISDGSLQWALYQGPDEIELERGDFAVSLMPGEAKEVSVLEFSTPDVTLPTKLTLKAVLAYESNVVQNEWEWWVFPNPILEGIAFFDPRGLFSGLEHKVPHVRRLTALDGISSETSVVITSTLTPELYQFVRGGGRVLYVQRGEGEFPIKKAPFWRESVQLFYPHKVTSKLPHENHTGTLFFGIATDTAFDSTSLPVHVPMLGRLDARNFELSQYLVELFMGKGLLVGTTLRLEGGLGNQPSGIQNNPVSLYLLDILTQYMRHWVRTP